MFSLRGWAFLDGVCFKEQERECRKWQWQTPGKIDQTFGHLSTRPPTWKWPLIRTKCYVLLVLLASAYPLVACAPHRVSQMPRPSTMQTNSQRPGGRDGVLSTLNVTIKALNLAKEICSITPAKAAFGSVVTLLAMIRVCFLLSVDYELPVYASLGVDGQREGLRRPRVVMRRCMSSSRSGLEGKTVR